MKINENELSWENFKSEVASSNSGEWVYRGHASKKWLLETTLGRFSKQQRKSILAKQHYEVLKAILSEEKIRLANGFEDLTLPNESPFLIGMLYANEGHKSDFIKVFRLMIKLRHFGFPSPLLDWTKNPYIAAFFASSNNDIQECMSILRLKVKNDFKPFDLQIHRSDFYFSENGSRHEKQDSIYTLAVLHEHRDTCIDKKVRTGPVFYLAYDELSLTDDVIIEKYIISDSKENRKKNFRRVI